MVGSGCPSFMLLHVFVSGYADRRCERTGGDVHGRHVSFEPRRSPVAASRLWNPSIEWRQLAMLRFVLLQHARFQSECVLLG